VSRNVSRLTMSGARQRRQSLVGVMQISNRQNRAVLACLEQEKSATVSQCGFLARIGMKLSRQLRRRRSFFGVPGNLGTGYMTSGTIARAWQFFILGFLHI
jgi:hypothetical protein